ncbi:MAG: restriction endonuclease [Chloroflexota bacterium]|nr:restriction endonuclease [Chloroflexota bacterium]MDE2969638.1 restriction endonuclease [Chloroflexota bacterium]
MSARKPELQDFGITSEEYKTYQGRNPNDLDGLGVFLGIAATLSVVVPIFFSIAFFYIVEKDAIGAIVVGSLLVIFPPGSLIIYFIMRLIYPINTRFMSYRLSKTRVGSASKLYEEALAAYERAQLEAALQVQREAELAEARRLEIERAREIERLKAEWARESARLEAEEARSKEFYGYWMALSGPEFERELGTVYRRLGYSVQSTAGSGDGGVDLILRKNGKTTVVQCKSHQAPVGPAIARELYGAMFDFRADRAILACTGGFTRGVVDFVRGKPITLLSASELVRLARGFEDNSLAETSGPPICPVVGCGKRMVAREGRYGRFWSCPRFPQCRGSRPMSGTRG